MQIFNHYIRVLQSFEIIVHFNGIAQVWIHLGLSRLSAPEITLFNLIRHNIIIKNRLYDDKTKNSGLSVEQG